ncbi:DedA family protein [Arcobacter sp. FWKO B]|uniref:DedA family protein n=1 Tax=Arcobacter sp. FWKO B TaxID=2593672 RepID=UPI0018A3F19B|nr:DedA family protein [Arcobacter sp. FWKO B]QOG11443.1 DedA family protein [Arcobacter sp. FWKO B]
MEELIRDWGYIILFLYSFGGGFVALVAAGVLSFSGELNIYMTIAVAAVANFIGDQFLFYMARTNKHFAKDIMQKYGRKVAYTHLLMRKYGYVAIFIQKYLYGVKTLVPLAIGLTKYSFTRFAFYNVFASILWAVVIGTVSYMLGEIVLTYAEEYKYYGVAVILAIVLFVSYLYKRI